MINLTLDTLKEAEESLMELESLNNMLIATKKSWEDGKLE